MFDLLDSTVPFLVDELPHSLPFIDGLISCVFVGGLRFSFRVVDRVKQRRSVFNHQERVLIIGAGNAGISLAQDMQRSPQLGLHPVAFVDDNPQKINLRIRGIPVVGERDRIPEIIKVMGIRRVIIAIPSAPGQVIREIVEICQATGIHTSTLPGIHEIINGRVGVESIRDVRIEDLLRREPVQTDIKQVSQFLKGKRVLITGAGGSIGSELSRQILKCQPSEIMLLGHGENSIFNIQQELEQVLQVLKHDGKVQGHQPNILTFIADIRFRDRLKHAFERFRPDVVFHAAAHKHVPLMEMNPGEAITNNVIGTQNHHGC
jgi:FlaA1/EpsC-like NDP-sugar epimerase